MAAVFAKLNMDRWHINNVQVLMLWLRGVAKRVYMIGLNYLYRIELVYWRAGRRYGPEGN